MNIVNGLVCAGESSQYADSPPTYLSNILIYSADGTACICSIPEQAFGCFGSSGLFHESRIVPGPSLTVHFIVGLILIMYLRQKQ